MRWRSSCRQGSSKEAAGGRNAGRRWQPSSKSERPGPAGEGRLQLSGRLLTSTPRLQESSRSTLQRVLWIRPTQTIQAQLLPLKSVSYALKPYLQNRLTPTPESALDRPPREADASQSPQGHWRCSRVSLTGSGNCGQHQKHSHLSQVPVCTTFFLVICENGW